MITYFSYYGPLKAPSPQVSTLATPSKRSWSFINFRIIPFHHSIAFYLQKTIVAVLENLTNEKLQITKKRNDMRMMIKWQYIPLVFFANFFILSIPFANELILIGVIRLFLSLFWATISATWNKHQIISVEDISWYEWYSNNKKYWDRDKKTLGKMLRSINAFICKRNLNAKRWYILENKQVWNVDASENASDLIHKSHLKWVGVIACK